MEIDLVIKNIAHLISTACIFRLIKISCGRGQHMLVEHLVLRTNVGEQMTGYLIFNLCHLSFLACGMRQSAGGENMQLFH